MTTAQQWLDLAERIEAATCADREIDAALHLAATSFEPRIAGPGWTPESQLVVPTFPGWAPLPIYTDSLDAALTLVPEGCWAEGSLGSHNCTTASLEIHAPMTYDPLGRATAPTPALALCAAACRARAGMEG